MGGFGSGRQGGGRCTEDMRALDVRKISRADLLSPGMSFNWQWSRRGEVTASIQMRVQAEDVILEYRNRSSHHNGGEWEAMRYAVRLDWTLCGFGGQRAWWRCPARGCGQRVALLYGGRVFACRQCHSLAYRSQRETEVDRTTRRANKLRESLGWQPGVLNGNGSKPKGMHWRTYWHLLGQYNHQAGHVLAGIKSKMGLIDDRLRELDAAMNRRYQR